MNRIEEIKPFLRGTTIVLVGGDPRPLHIQRLEAVFELKQAIWASIRDSDASSRRFAAVLRRADASLVVALNGLLRHQHARDLRALCRKQGLPLLAYWRSPHPEGLAAAITEQHLISLIRRAAA